MADSFGDQLRAARQRAGFDSYRKLAQHLSRRDHDIATETLGNYERDLRKPHRADLLPILSELAYSTASPSDGERAL
ncbi:MAG: hypothetical protein U0670_14140 [Anaerolineae bacterium]